MRATAWCWTKGRWTPWWRRTRWRWGRGWTRCWVRWSGCSGWGAGSWRWACCSPTSSTTLYTGLSIWDGPSGTRTSVTGFQPKNYGESYFSPCCGSKYIEFGSRSRSLTQFGPGSRSGSMVLLSNLKETNFLFFLNIFLTKKIMLPEEIFYWFDRLRLFMVNLCLQSYTFCH